MNADVERIFNEVADLSRAEREEFFARHAVPEEIQTEVESLLRFDEDSTDFLEGEVRTSIDSSLNSDDHGRLCGPYRLGCLLGQGGMGAVYLAERVDGEVRQQVAVKLLRHGLGDPLGQQRFLQERQILAALNHPNIARLLDAGRLADGQPYLVMEYVDGEPIDKFAQDLTIRQKIELVLEVCAAISYAHRNLVVHRDLKPGNILVDASHHTKLLDFGIAKILDENVDRAQTVQRVLTVEYASPEQTLGLPVTTATDVYSMAGVLYKLLTGKGPHEFGETTTAGILRAIQTREVTRPSALVSELKGDLNTILQKALRKEPAERYGSIDEFANDLEAFLASRPISARRGEWPYQTRKFVRRRWAPLAAVAVALIGLTVGLVMAARERNIAQRRFAQVRQLADQLFDIDHEVEPLAGSVQARQTIVNTALGYIDGLQREAAGDPQLLMDLATALEHVAGVQGGGGRPNLGQPREALRNLQRAESLRNQALAARPGDRAVLRGLLGNLEAQARTDYTASREEEGRDVIERGIPPMEKLLASSGVTAEDYAAAAAFSRSAAGVYLVSGPFQGALPFSIRTLEYARKAEQLKPSRESKGKLAEALYSRGDILRADGQVTEALRVLDEADHYLDGAQKEYPDDESLRTLSLKTAYTKGITTGDYTGPSQRRFRESIPLLQRAFDMSEAKVARNPGELYSHYFLSIAAWKLGRALEDSDPGRALSVFRRGIGAFEGFPPDHPQHRSSLRSMAGSIHCLILLHRTAEIRPLVDQGFELMRILKRYPTTKLGPSAGDTEFLQAYAEAELALGNRSRSDQTAHEIVEKFGKFSWEKWGDLQDATSYSWHLERLAKIERDGGNKEFAAALDAQRMDYWKKWKCNKPGNEAISALLAGIPPALVSSPCSK